MPERVIVISKIYSAQSAHDFLVFLRTNEQLGLIFWAQVYKDDGTCYTWKILKFIVHKLAVIFLNNTSWGNVCRDLVTPGFIVCCCHVHKIKILTDRQLHFPPGQFYLPLLNKMREKGNSRNVQ